jgi:ABC-2 type transport system ATP-binding protein
LDEPAAGLDPRARIELRQMIRALAAEGKTILVSSHILTELAEMCDRVGIIELGRLIAVGSVEEIQHGHAQHTETRTEIKIRPVNGSGSLLEWLAGRGDAQEVRQDGEFVRLSIAGGRVEQAALLREIVLAGFDVAEFGGHTKSLEEVFMHVTRGAVQ